MTHAATKSETRKTPPLVPYRRAPSTRQRGPRGDRYDRREAYQHGAGLGQPARPQAIPTAIVAIDDPLEPGKRLLATVNRRVDILEDERSHGRISVSQYETARQVQAVFERATGARLGSGGWNVGGSRDQTIAHELAIIYAIEDARVVRALLGRVEKAVGTVGARFLKSVLADRQTFAQAAEARGKAGERGTSQVAAHFRILLEGLDEAFASNGLVREIESFFRTPDTGEETDARGTVVPAGHGHAWGVDQARYAAHMNEEAAGLAEPTRPRWDRVAANRRRVSHER
ncbi:hypothetical protein [Methylobacterium nonmethylotrophicum]|uniref:Uncharacterized protein n=1 Tax=Methylobacterium nonmethylotrophicum TaxID=1141884 RepID=A0A4Z0NDX0_9HYPH|nr:hypothetical protein [Methylobacterium nonmethylotrophicum]TGD94049.1 hypothetical protein EU555_32515 [Methylobacterium nonmethylotrophicum]